MTGTVRALRVADTAPVTEAVERFEKFLEMAKSGQLRSFAVVAECTDGEIHEVWGGDATKSALIAGLESLKARIVRHWNGW